MFRIIHIIRALSKIERLILIGALLVLTVSGSLKFIFYVQANTEIVPSKGGLFKEGVIGQPVFINPVMPTTDVDRDMAELIFSSVSDISESIKKSDDGRAWTVRIDENAFWHDGERLTTDDILFTLDVIQDKDSRSHLFSMFQGVTAERISELEIKFNLQSPYAFFATEHLNSLKIIPKHIFEDIPVQNFRLSIYGLKPLGSGPYKAASYKKDEKGIITSFDLLENEAYFKERPNIDRIVFKYYRNEGELIQAYNSAQIDGFGLSSAESLSLLDDSAIGSLIRHKLHNLKSSRYYALFINQPLGPKELKNAKVRRALSETINRDLITADLFRSYSTTLYGPSALTPRESSPYDLAVLKDLNLNITVPEERFLIKTAEEIKIMWESAGVKVNLMTVPIKQIQDRVLRNTDYEILLFGNITGLSQDLFSFWHSSRRFYPDQNLSLYQNKKIDALLESYRKDVTDDNKIEELQIISDTIAYDYPAIFLYSPDYIYVSTPNLHGLNMNKPVNTSADRFADIENWYVKTKRVF